MVDLEWNVALLGRGATFGFRACGAASLQPPPSPPTSSYISPSLGASRVDCEPCQTCGHEAESDVVKALQCVRKLWFRRGIDIISSFPPTFFIFHVVRCSELAVLGFGVVLGHQHSVIFGGTLLETSAVCSGKTTCPIGR